MEEKKKEVVVAFSGGLDTSFTVMSVSYTHLDVYKRQTPLRNKADRNIPNRFLFLKNNRKSGVCCLLS